VLSAFFPLDASTLENHLAADLAADGWPGEKNDDPAAGEAIGRAWTATAESILNKASRIPQAINGTSH